MKETRSWGCPLAQYQILRSTRYQYTVTRQVCTAAAQTSHIMSFHTVVERSRALAPERALYAVAGHFQRTARTAIFRNLFSRDHVTFCFTVYWLKNHTPRFRFEGPVRVHVELRRPTMSHRPHPRHTKGHPQRVLVNLYGLSSVCYCPIGRFVSRRRIGPKEKI